MSLRIWHICAETKSLRTDFVRHAAACPQLYTTRHHFSNQWDSLLAVGNSINSSTRPAVQHFQKMSAGNTARSCKAPSIPFSEYRRGEGSLFTALLRRHCSIAGWSAEKYSRMFPYVRISRGSQAKSPIPRTVYFELCAALPHGFVQSRCKSCWNFSVKLQNAST